jgi:DNA-binding transcriptional regulator GbsR (MarR family)
VEVIEIFVSIVRMLGIPKSVAEIYGLLFVTAEPLPLDEIVDRLQISKGSVSQGLKLLRSFGGVKPTYVAGDRRDHYLAETELKKLVTGFMRGEVQPRLNNGGDRLQHVKSLTSELPEVARKFLDQRVGKLQQWHQKSRDFLPLLSVMLDEEIAS